VLFDVVFVAISHASFVSQYVLYKEQQAEVLKENYEERYELD